MEKITNLKDLLIEQIRELYNAEKQQQHALPKLKEKAEARELKLAIQYHLAETADHITRLEKVFQQLEVASFGEESEAMQKLIKEGYDLVERSSDPEVLDASIIAAMQYMEHFEMAGYGTACTYANELGLREIAEQLHFTLDEEKKIDEKLTEMAIAKINQKAKSPVIV
ncbi:MAG: DUF892 family protein [Reichenbachiella sp.]|uniref:YciE/YciF ferroxidase family protein n=1 Tax=Reichenbachiella sp. TaxID=2184521 RepID=UPI003266AB48